MAISRRGATTILVIILGVLVATVAGLVAAGLERAAREQEISAAVDNRIAAFKHELQSEQARLEIVAAHVASESHLEAEKLRVFMRAVVKAVSARTHYFWVPSKGVVIPSNETDGPEVARAEIQEAADRAVSGSGMTLSRQMGEMVALVIPVAGRGIVVGVFSPKEVMERAFQSLRPFGINAAVYDLDAEAGSRPLTFHHSRRSVRVPAPSPWETLPAGNGYRQVLTVSGRRWLVWCEPISELQYARPSWPIVGLTMAGCTVSLLAGVLMRRAEARRMEIESVVERRTRQLAEARDEALEAARLKSQFVANVSHELRTPLHGMLGVNGLLQDSELTAEQLEHCETMRTCGKALLTLVEDLLDVSQMEAGVLRIVVENFGLRQVVSECATIASGAAASKGLAWTVTVSPELPDGLRGDGSRVRQVLVNLVANAIKFTDAGGIILRVEREGPAGLRFSVEDTGCGIPEAAQRRIFTQFGQVDGTTTRKHRGFGLGLSISKYLVERMGGEIGFVSRENAGSTFWFTLPLQLADPVAPPETKVDPPAQFCGSRVLVAEDNVVNQRLAKRMLERLGFEVELANDGSEAVGKARDASFDLILMDLQMPEMDGLEAARRIRSEERNGRRTPIVAFSANANESDVVAALAAGMDDHLSKPVDLARLDSVLRRCLEPSNVGIQEEATVRLVLKDGEHVLGTGRV